MSVKGAFWPLKQKVSNISILIRQDWMLIHWNW